MFVLEAVFCPLNRDECGININGKKLNNLRFAENIVLIAPGK